jgi:hypothetical protein
MDRINSIAACLRAQMPFKSIIGELNNLWLFLNPLKYLGTLDFQNNLVKYVMMKR